MIVLDQIIDILESLLRVSVAVVVDGFLNACKEVVKFVLILLLLYHFLKWSFQFLEDVLPETETLIETVLIPGSPFNNTIETDIVAHQVLGETCLRIGPPDETLIKQRASLLEQLEIEAEFEEHQAKLRKSDADLEQFVKKEIHTVAPKTRESEDIGLNKDYFISQIKQELYETSRSSQTIKTSLGKKSKLKEQRESGSSNRDYITQEEDELLKKFKTNNNLEIGQEVNQDLSATVESTSSNLKEFQNVEKRQSYDDQYDHESFHRV